MTVGIVYQLELVYIAYKQGHLPALILEHHIIFPAEITVKAHAVLEPREPVGIGFIHEYIGFQCQSADNCRQGQL